MNELIISPEIARLAQERARGLASSSDHELARLMAGEAIMSLDPEHSYLLDEGSAFSQSDVLTQALGVNDLVVNGRHVDVRALNAEGKAVIRRSLIVSQYLIFGSLVVDVTSISNGRLIGYISARAWQEAERKEESNQQVEIPVEALGEVDLPAVLQSIMSIQTSDQNSPQPAVSDSQLEQFICTPERLSMTAQKQLVWALLSNEDLQNRAAQVLRRWSRSSINRVLTAGAIWNSRTEKLCDRLCLRFDKIPRSRIKELVANLGQSLGGQPEAPEFKRQLLVLVAAEELSLRLPQVESSRLQALSQKVWSGTSAIEAVSDFVKNRVAFDLAVAINRQRERLENFVSATAEEIGLAYQQLALQPAYATHSRDPQSGVDAINEALAMLKAAELAEGIKQMESELFE